MGTRRARAPDAAGIGDSGADGRIAQPAATARAPGACGQTRAVPGLAS
jgi:hypothetical protein